MISKKEIIGVVLNNLKDDLKKLQVANEAASKGATDSESRAETKWDTGGLEASYLARGYAKKFEQTVNNAEQLKSLLPDDYTNSAIGMGALVKCDMDGYVSSYFLLPCCGGMELYLGDEEITVITMESPIGRELARKRAGNLYNLPNGRSGKILSVQ